ncbi:MAG: hypothetical protein IKH00_04615 [Bacteroidales bacterium]|nr:hypothetical protein [Bacteroidales bacterium]
MDRFRTQHRPAEMSVSEWIDKTSEDDLREKILRLSEILELVIALGGNAEAALRLLREANINHRLALEDLLAKLPWAIFNIQDLKLEMEQDLEDLLAKQGKN